MAHLEESDDDDYRFFGTPIVDEQDTRVSTAAKRQDPSTVRSAPVSEQEPKDEQGRKRFHGAFTGGFSAGFFNTVGSKEGFQPATFRSSRDERFSAKQQSVEDFMDEDEKQERSKITLQVKPEFDTFGSAAAEVARAVTQRESESRPSLFPGSSLVDILTPVATSLGAQLLQKMGWRPGRGVIMKESREDSNKKRKWGTVAGVSLENTPLYVLEPKQDVNGLGFDPFAGAEDFRQLKKQRVELQQRALQQAAADATSKLGMGGGARQQQAQQGDGKGKRTIRGVAFGGYTDDSGMYGYVEDYADEDDPEGTRPDKASLLQGADKRQYHFELAGSDSDDDAGPSRRKRPLLLEPGEGPTPLMIQSSQQLRRGGDFVPGFKKSDEQVTIPIYPPPDIPPGWRPNPGKYLSPPPATATHQQATQDQLPPPPECPPPDDPVLKHQIDSLAVMVARSGKQLEDLARKQAAAAQQLLLNQQAGHGSHAGGVDDDQQQTYHDHPGSKYAFLVGGEGYQYYTWRLHKIRSALATLVPVAQPDSLTSAGSAGITRQPQTGGNKAGRNNLTVEERMAMLGEEALPVTITNHDAKQGVTGLEAVENLAGAALPKKAIAEGDRQRLQAALQSTFVKASTEDLASADQAQQQFGLRHVQSDKDKNTSAAGKPALSSALPLSGAAAAVLAGFGNRFTSAGQQDMSAGTSEARAAGLLQPSNASSKPNDAHANNGSGSATAQGGRGAETKAPRRWFEDWRPEPIICRRFNVPDPYKGKAKPVEMSKFKTDYLALPETALGLGMMQQEAQQQDVGAHNKAAPQLALPPPPPLPATFIPDTTTTQHALPTPSNTSAAAAAALQLPGPPPLPGGVGGTFSAAVNRAQAIAARLTGAPAAQHTYPGASGTVLNTLAPTSYASHAEDARSIQQQQHQDVQAMPSMSAAVDAKSAAAMFLDNLASGFGLGGDIEQGHGDVGPATDQGSKSVTAAHNNVQQAEPALPRVQVQPPANATILASAAVANIPDQRSDQEVTAGHDDGCVEDVFAPSADFPSLDRPLDIFKAIFEAEDDNEEEQEPEQQQQQRQQHEQDTAEKQEGQAGSLGTAGNAAGNAAALPGSGGTVQQLQLADALLRAQKVAAEKRAAAQAAAPADGAQHTQQQAAGGTFGSAPTQEGVAPGFAVDPEVQHRILAALKLMKKSKKEKKDKKEKKKKEKKTHKHKSKDGIDKHKKKKSKGKKDKKDKKSSRKQDKARSRSVNSDSESGTDSGSDASDTTTSSGSR